MNHTLTDEEHLVARDWTDRQHKVVQDYCDTVTADCNTFLELVKQMKGSGELLEDTIDQLSFKQVKAVIEVFHNETTNVNFDC